MKKLYLVIAAWACNNSFMLAPSPEEKLMEEILRSGALSREATVAAMLAEAKNNPPLRKTLLQIGRLDMERKKLAAARKEAERIEQLQRQSDARLTTAFQSQPQTHASSATSSQSQNEN